MRLHTSALAAITLAAMSPVGMTQAATSVSANAFVGEGNQAFSNTLGTFGSTNTPLLVVNGAGGSSYDLTDAGGSGTLDFNGQASATASYNALKASASGMLSNNFFDENYDYDAGTGIPTAYYAQGSASFTQTLQYGGTAINYTSTYALKLTGTVAGSGRAAVFVEMQHASEVPQSWFFDTNGSYNVLLYSQAYILGGVPETFSLRINTLYSFDTDALAPGGNFSGGADFGNTLEVVGIDLRDEFGNLQAGTITSDTGENFAIVAIPEPSSLFLASLSLSAAFLSRSRRK